MIYGASMVYVQLHGFYLRIRSGEREEERACELSIFKGLRSCMLVLKFTSPEEDPEHPRIKYQIF